MRLDLHVHTIYSAVPGFPFLRDSFNHFEDIVRVAREKGIDGVGITDHNTLEGAVRFKEYVRRKGFNVEVVVGEEVKTRSGDIIALDIETRIPPRMTVEETLDRIRDCNGLSVVAHPYAYNGVGEEIVRTLRFNLIETLNSCVPSKMNDKAKELAVQLGLPGAGGSDAHRPKVIGNALTVVRGDAPVRESLEKGRTIVEGKTSPRFGVFQKVLLRARNPREIFCNPFH